MKAESMPLVKNFIHLMTTLYEKPHILLTGAKVWPGSSNNTDWQTIFPFAKFTRTDIEAGDGVDVVADLCNYLDFQLYQLDFKGPTGKEFLGFDGIICPWTLEHGRRPWTAVATLSNCMARGGYMLIVTHQTFPLHGYPQDYYRFSTDALASLCMDNGLEVVEVEYTSPCKIVPTPVVDPWSEDAPSYLKVAVIAKRPEGLRFTAGL